MNKEKQKPNFIYGLRNKFGLHASDLYDVLCAH